MLQNHINQTEHWKKRFKRNKRQNISYHIHENLELLLPNEFVNMHKI